MSIKISVIIPTFRRPHLLIKCLTALKVQLFTQYDFEVIVVTDGPDEVTRNEIDFFKNNYLLQHFFCESLDEKKGPAAARNRGALLAAGELLVFTDDDCIPKPDWLQEYWQAYSSQHKKGVAFSGQTIVPVKRKPTDYEKNIANLETAEFITANCACTKHAFEKAGGFDEAFPVAWREDSDLYFSLIKAYVQVVKVAQAVVVHPVRSAPWGISLQEQKKGMYNALLYKKHPLLYRKKIGAKPMWNYYAIVLLLLTCLVSCLMPVKWLAAITFSGWLLLTSGFIVKRLKGTSKGIPHIVEIIATSVAIPFLSIFWTLVGSFKYKTFLL